MTKLQSYKNKYRVTDRSIAEQVGVDVSYIRKIRHGVRRPSPELAARISAATGGKVSIMELLFPNGVPDAETPGSGSADSFVEERENDTGCV